jgi:arylsulfatase A-like enzyme
MNVIVVVSNGLHLGFLGAYGNAWIETPHLDRLAAQGVLFEHHFAENLTTIPTRRSWWTGRYTFPNPDLGWTPLRHDETILPDLLWNQGVRTALISDVPYLREAGQGFGRGFDDVVWIRGAGYDPCIPASDRRAQSLKLEDEPGLRLPHDEDDPEVLALWRERWMNFLRNRHVLGRSASTSRTIDAAADWLHRHARDAQNQPFLLWVDLFAPHGPWDPPGDWRDRYATLEPDDFETGDEDEAARLEADADDSDLDLAQVATLLDVPPGAVGDVLDEPELLRLRRTYAGCVSHLDEQLGRLMHTLQLLGRDQDTLLVFTADQGEPLGEHGYVRRFRPWLYEELIHTPLILRLPRAERAGSRHRALVQPVDLAPTILSALGLPPQPECHGGDLLQLARGEHTKIRDYACLGMDVEEFAIRTQHWHLILPLTHDPEEPRAIELYRKPEDRWDQNNVASQHPDVADALELGLRRFAAAIENDALDDLPPLREVARLGGEA